MAVALVRIERRLADLVVQHRRLIKFFPNGKGGGAGPVEYLTARAVLSDENRNLIRDASNESAQPCVLFIKSRTRRWQELPDRQRP